jgi:aldehyde:ferredoxin oxidoreductase
MEVEIMSRNAFMGKVLFVNISDGTYEEMALEENVYRQYIGGSGLGVKVLFEKMKAKVDPLGPDNIIGFTVGPLCGTKSPSAGRFTVVGKSPLTGGWGEANCGGHFGPALKSTGYDGVFISGKSEKPVYLLLTDEKIEIKDATHLWGKDSIETEEGIREELGLHGIRVACIGQAGENQSKIAAIMHDHGRAAGRSGLGAVMGSKTLKAIAATGSLKAPMANEEEFNRIAEEMKNEILKNPTPVAEFFGSVGTAGTYSGSVAAQDSPIQNWKGVVQKAYTVEQAEKISGEAYNKYKKRKYACAQCQIVCGAIVELKDASGNVILTSHRPEYETISAFGSMCLVDDIETIIKANDLCNRYGFDTISAGATIAFAMECFEEGFITLNDTGGIPLEWGNKEAITNLIELMSQRMGIGDVLADGVKSASERIDKSTGQFAIHVGGQEVPMHDPRCNPGYGYTYEFDPTPGRHTQGGLAWPEIGLGDPNLESYQLGDLPSEKYNYDSEGKGHAQAVYNHWYHFMSATGLCLFGPLGYQRYPLLEIVRVLTGWDEFDLNEAVMIGERINTLRHLFNLREDLMPDDFKLPKRLRGIPCFTEGPLKDVTLDIASVKEAYYSTLDWDPINGKPSDEKMNKLGLSVIMSQI